MTMKAVGKSNRRSSFLVSVHIPKTGGLTFLDNVLEPTFGDRLLLDYNDRPMTHDDAERNMHAIRFFPSNEVLTRYDCIHGHFLPVKYANSIRHCEFVCWLRNPVQRVISRFFQGKRAASTNPQNNSPIGDMTFTEFLSWDRLHNLYAKYLWRFDLDRFDFVGITEEYERSINVFRLRFGIDTWRGRAVNVNPDKDYTRPYDVSDKTREFIERTNLEDMDIYERGKRHLDALDRLMR